MFAILNAPALPGGCFAFMGGTVGGFELLVLFAAILLLFGPRRLPEIARSLGRVLQDLRRASDDFRGEIMRIDELPPEDPPAPSPAPTAEAPVTDADEPVAPQEESDERVD